MLPTRTLAHNNVRYVWLKKLIFLLLCVTFTAYLTSVHLYMNLPESDTLITSKPISADDSDKMLSTEPESNETSHTWERKSFRDYVWMEIAIDDVIIGRITAELFTDLVPKTAKNFKLLTTGEMGSDFSYSNSKCHRILKGFIVQCGDFTEGNGYGGRSIYGSKFDDEPNGLRLKHSKRYVLQMANSGANTNGSQFCIMLGPAPHLNGKHVVFGEIIDGFEVVDKMEAAGVDHDGDPTSHTVKILRGGQIEI